MKTLILNANFKPLSMVSKQRAIVLYLYNKNLKVLSYYKEKIRTENFEIQVPAVMLYNRYIHRIKNIYPNKRNIRQRDNGRCGYCNKLLNTDIFTIDHIIPVSRFSSKNEANTWENQISCCKNCNIKKGNRTPTEANMSLLYKPKKIYSLIISEQTPEEWSCYI